VQALAERPDLSAAVLDFGLKDGVTGARCEHLNTRGIPSVIYTGYPQVGEACHKGIICKNPNLRGEVLFDTLSCRDRLLRSAAGAPVECGFGAFSQARGFPMGRHSRARDAVIKKGTPMRGRRPRFLAGRGAGLQPVAQTTGMASTYSCVPCFFRQPRPSHA
jgi:hypothetical protein